MKSAHALLLVAISLLSAGCVWSAPYPNEAQLRSSIADASAIVQAEGLLVQAIDAQKVGLNRPLMAARLDLTTGTCRVYFNTKPENGLIQFFAAMNEKDFPLWLGSIAVHEVTHCIEQREAYVNQRFDKVRPPGLGSEKLTLQGYLSAMNNGAGETWSEALADIASVLYLKAAAPDDWRRFADGLATMRESLAYKWPQHNTAPWLRRMIAAPAGEAPNLGLFESAFQLRRQYRPN